MKAKLLAILFAFLVWAFIVSSGEQVRKFPEPLEIKAFNITEGLSVANQSEWEDVTVYLSSQKDVQDLPTEEISAYLDLGGLTAGGEYELAINITVKNSDFRVVKVEPESLKVRLQETISKSLEVKTKVTGKLSTDYEMGTITVEPLKVQAKGAESDIENTAAVLAVLELTGEETGDIDRQVDLIAVNDLDEEIPGIILTPQKASFRAPVTRISDEKVVTIKANLGGTVPKSGYWLEKVEVNPATITLTGDPKELAEIENLQTTAIDITDIEKTTQKKAQLILPEGVEVTNSEVTITAFVTEQESSREVFANIEIINLLPSLEVEKITPASLQVELKGSFESLKNLEESKVKFLIDMTNKEAGTYEIGIDRNMLKIPYALQAGDLPEQDIEITLIETS